MLVWSTVILMYRLIYILYCNLSQHSNVVRWLQWSVKYLKIWLQSSVWVIHTRSCEHQSWHTSVSAGGSIGGRVVNGGSTGKTQSSQACWDWPQHVTAPLVRACWCVWADTGSRAALVSGINTTTVYLYLQSDMANIITEQSNLWVHAWLMWHTEANVPPQPVSWKKEKHSNMTQWWNPIFGWSNRNFPLNARDGGSTAYFPSVQTLSSWTHCFISHTQTLCFLFFLKKLINLRFILKEVIIISFRGESRCTLIRPAATKVDFKRTSKIFTALTWIKLTAASPLPPNVQKWSPNVPDTSTAFLCWSCNLESVQEWSEGGAMKASNCGSMRVELSRSEWGRIQAHLILHSIHSW